MHEPFYNDQAHIAEEFHLIEEHTQQTARLASFKISSYKLALYNSAYCANKDELRAIILSSLMNYTDSASVLAAVGFFTSEIEN
ncbi:MAG: hypothetical protein QM781_03325 [Chitinophagaceae bacterium]